MWRYSHLKSEFKNYWEIAASARKIIDPLKIEIDSNKIERIVKEILSCVICLQIYDTPTNIKKCLHKFCKKCAEDYHRQIKYFLLILERMFNLQTGIWK